MKYKKKIFEIKSAFHTWLYKDKLTNFIISLGILNLSWLTRQSWIDYSWLIHRTTPLRPIDFLILCVVVPIHWLIVTVVLFNFFFKKETQVPNYLRHLFLLDVFYVAFRIHADMTTSESTATHYLIAFVNIVVLCGFNWACFYNCITPKAKER